MFQQSAMMSLGLFVFMRQTIPYQETSREINWHHATNNVIGKLPRSQFTGKAGETLTLTGTLMPEITGGTISLFLLEQMAEQGEAYPLIDGSSFMVQGFFVIESISQNASFFFGDGTPRRIDFSMTLKRTDDSILPDVIDNLIGMI